MTRADQFACIEFARTNLMRWAEEQGISLYRIGFVVPFVETDLGLSAWFFFETDEQLRRSGAMGWTGRLSARLMDVLEALGDSAPWLTNMGFVWDSHENVIHNYEGSYFYRVR